MKGLALTLLSYQVLQDSSPVSDTVWLLAQLVKHIVELLPIIGIFRAGEFLNRFGKHSSLVLVQYVFDLNPRSNVDRCGPAELITHHCQGICKCLKTKRL